MKKARAANAKESKSTEQWKVVRGIHLDDLERQLDTLAANNWGVLTILGPLSDGFAIVAWRRLTL